MMKCRRLQELACAVLVAAVLSLVLPSLVSAEPYIAMREGMKCSQCHANMTGGGKRNDFGGIYSQTRLPAIFYAPWQETPANEHAQMERDEGKEPWGSFFSGRINQYLAVGGDLRTGNSTVFKPSYPALLQPSQTSNDFYVDEANLYVEADLLEDHLALYLDTQFAPGGVTAREAFALLQNLPGSSYIKAGRFYLPYGLRLEDDDAFIRRNTGFNFSTSDVGVEIGLEPGPFSLSVALANGTGTAAENNADKQVSFVGSYVHRWFRVGGSYSFNEAPVAAKRYVFGGFGGFTIGRLTFLGEADWIVDKFVDSVTLAPLLFKTRDMRLAILGEANLLLVKGVNFKTTYEFYNPDLGTAGDEQTRWSFVLEPFVTQFLQPRVGVRISDGPPQYPSQNVKEIFAELHIFL